MRDENGLEKCVACGLCAVACPADAIYLEAAENDGSVQAGPRYAERLPDPQDALHLLRLLRGGLPGLGDLHGQGLRARRLQQQGLHLGQDGPAGAGARDDARRDDCRPGFGVLGDIHGAFDAARAIVRAASRDPVLALRRRHRRRAGATNRSRAASTGSTATTTASTPSPPAICRRISITSRTGLVEIAGSGSGLHGGPAAGRWRSAEHSRRRGTRRAASRAAASEEGEAPKAHRSCDDKRRHFVREEVEACKALRGVDVFLTHEAREAVPAVSGAGPDAGKAQINEILRAMKPPAAPVRPSPSLLGADD